MADGDGLSDALMIVMANAGRTALGGVQLHTGAPGVGGAANKSSAPMLVPVWTTPTANGDFGLAASMDFEGGTPNGPCPYASLWSNTSGSGNWYGNIPLSGDLNFDSAGNITIEELDLDGDSGT